MIGNAGTALFNTFSLRPGRAAGRARPVRRLRRWALAGVVAFAVTFAACAEDVPDNPIATCRDLLDKLDWNATVAACENAVTTAAAADADTAKSLAAQAYMGRAGVSLLDLLDKLQNSTLTGLTLVLDAFTVTVGTAAFTDVEAAITHLQGITAPTETDYFNLTVASDVILTTLLKAHLAISVSPTGVLTIPGITNANLETLTDPTNFTAVQGVFQTLYTTAGSYYAKTPLVWDSGSVSTPDLKKISGFVEANRIGSAGIGLGTDASLADLASLNFSTSIDNGQCGYGAGTTTVDPANVAKFFPRRLNTSEATAAYYLADDLYYTLLSITPPAEVDSAKEWAGSFILPSALLNPDHYEIDCGGGGGDGTAATSEFSTCMGAGGTVIGGYAHSLLPAPTQSVTGSLSRFPGNATQLCGGAACDHWPLLRIIGAGAVAGDNLLSDESTANGAAAKTELAQVLDTAFPIDNTVTSSITGTHPAYACAAADDLVHYREYDFYLRSFGQ